MADDGSIYLHLDTKKIHYLKVVMDEVFGESRFSSEIIWKRTSAHSDADGYQFNMVSPKSYNVFFQKLRDGGVVGFRSDLDVAMTKAAKADS
jgi:adenine specific DNA methylase Mod